MHHSRILKRAFSVAHHRAAAERKNLPGYRDVSGEDYEAEILRRRKIGKRSQKAGPISELGLLHPRQIGSSEKPSAETSSLISAAVGVVAPRCWSKVLRAFLTRLLLQSRIAQQIGDSMSQLSRRIDLDCSAANSKLSGQ